VDNPTIIYIDELQLTSIPAGDDDREVFLQHLPVEDYSEPDLRDWLDAFGKVEATTFLRDAPGGNLTGSGYVRFSSKDEAENLLQTCQEESEDVSIKGAWSLSEQILKGRAGPMKVDCLQAIQAKLRTVQQKIGAETFFLVGTWSLDAPDPASPSWLAALGLGLEAGPLHFVSSPKHKAGSAEALRSFLASELKQELCGNVKAAEPPAAAGQQQTARTTRNGRPSSAAPAVVGAKKVSDRPCIVVKGFPPSWTEKEARLVFAVFGGVSSVQLSEEVGGRVARVELKNAENMHKAVNQLNNTQVGDGDLIEECTIMCHIEGGATPSLQHWSLFVDELPMPKRPQVRPGHFDREVFLQSLPVHDCTEENIRSWLEGFGSIEDMMLLKNKVTGKLTGKGYVRFTTHREASACVEAHTRSSVDDGDPRAHWSESERAVQMKQSVYGEDVHNAFSQQALEQVKRQCKVQSLWMLSEAKARGPDAPAAEARYVHFITTCPEEQVAALKSQLARVLASFHQEVSRSLPRAAAASGKRPREETPVDGERPPGEWKPAQAHPPGSFGAGGIPQATGGPPGQHHPPGVARHGTAAGYAKGQPAVAKATVPDRPPRPQPASGQSRAEGPGARRAPEESSRSGERSAREKGEAEILIARSLLESNPREAYQKYRTGLQLVMDWMQKHPEDDQLRARAEEYLSELEKLDAQLKTTHSKSKDGTEARRDDGGAARGRHPPKLGSEDLEKLEKSDELFKEGESQEGKKRHQEAYESYTHGLQYLMEVVGKMEGKNDLKDQKAACQKKAQKYLEKAEKLKEQLSLTSGGGRESQRHAQKATESRDRDSRAPRQGSVSDRRQTRHSRERSPRREGRGDGLALRSRSRTGTRGRESTRGREHERHRDSSHRRDYDSHRGAVAAEEPKATRCKAAGAPPPPAQPQRSVDHEPPRLRPKAGAGAIAKARGHQS